MDAFEENYPRVKLIKSKRIFFMCFYLCRYLHLNLMENNFKLFFLRMLIRISIQWDSHSLFGRERGFNLHFYAYSIFVSKVNLFFWIEKSDDKEIGMKIFAFEKENFFFPK